MTDRKNLLTRLSVVTWLLALVVLATPAWSQTRSAVPQITGENAASAESKVAVTKLPATRLDKTKQDKTKQGKPKPPIQALLVTGGCCHDYTRQKQIIAQGVSARANVRWTIVQQGGNSGTAKIPLYQNPNWARGFDVVVHNECFARIPDKAWVDRILRPHRKGVPAVLIHCAMHCYRTGDDSWFKFVGVQSPGHGPKYSYEVKNLQPQHPIMATFGKSWVAPKGELYHTVKLFPTAKPLAQADRRRDGKPQTCVWTNNYHGTKVFATTIGHYNETMVEPTYLDMLTRGILWATDRLEDGGLRKTDAKTDAAIRALATRAVPPSVGQPTPATRKPTGKKKGKKQATKKKATQPQAAGKGAGNSPTADVPAGGNLAKGATVFASSEEKGKNNFARNAVDGDRSTRWCAAGSRPGVTWTLDFKQPRQVQSLRIHWEKANAAYRYQIHGSSDGEQWQLVVDASKNKKPQQIMPHKLAAPVTTRYLRVTFQGAAGNYWGSFWEFEAYDGPLPALPKSVTAPAAKVANVTGGIRDVRAPEGFEVRMFAEPPQVNYPVCLTTAVTGEVFIGIDEQGSLGKEKGRGRVVRCVDRDGDGKADEIREFAKMDHPRGLVYDNGSLWVLHPPLLSVYHDDDLDGRADRSQVLVTGISTDQVNRRGADHTTNGIRMGVDGWIYIAVGDFGFVRAAGSDGVTLDRRGGGVVRVRPDGSDLEIYSWGQRNIVDVAIDPEMNLFTRDNTNDGGGWDIRVSHVQQSANYGYPSLYKNFSDEIMPPLADYGGGSGCGALYVHNGSWPADFGRALFTCDWGRSQVYVHRLSRQGASFAPHQESFVRITRPTDMDIDGSGRMYISSWLGGKFNYSGPNVGYVAQLVPSGFVPQPVRRLDTLTNAQLLAELNCRNDVVQRAVQREVLRRGQGEQGIVFWGKAMLRFAQGKEYPTSARIAAVYTLKQLQGAASHTALSGLYQYPPLRRTIIRALTDRKRELANVSRELLLAALADKDPFVQAQAVIAIGRFGDLKLANALLPLTAVRL